jgi:hypothetical protein
MGQEKDSFQWWIDKGSELVGQVAGAWTGAASSNPILGVGVGFGTTEGLRRIGTEVRKWKLGPREEKRIGAIFLYTSHALKDRLASGEKLREDGFFDLDETGKSKDEEIAEAIVIAAEREHEERKIPYLGQLYAFIATRDSIDQGLANHLVRLAKSLSYRQYCILALRDSELRGELSPRHGTTQHREFTPQEYSALLEFQELYEKRLIEFPSVLGVPNLRPDQMRFYEMQLFGIGHVLYEGLRLKNITSIDLRPVAKLLSRSAR